MLLEVLLGMLLLLIVAGGVVAGFSAASSQIGSTRLDVESSKIAQQKLEDVRAMPYSGVGVVSGNPPGTIPATTTQTVNGITYKIQTTVKYVDNPALGQPHTYVDYKSVTVVVTPSVPSGQPVTESTLVAPPNYASMSGLSTSVVTVVDAVTLQPLSGMTVSISGGPSATRSDLTSTNGTVVFAGLTPNPSSTSSPQYNYTVQVAQAGWSTDATTDPSVTTAHLSASQTWQVTIKVFKPTTITANLVDSATGQPISDYSSVTVASPSPQSLTDSQGGTTGAYTFTTLQGQPIEPSQSAFNVTATADCYASQTITQAIPTGYPNLTSQALTFSMVAQAGGHLTATVLNASTNKPIPGATMQISGGQNNISPVVRTTDVNGIATFCEPPSGSTNYTLAAGASGYGAGSTSAAITNGSTTTVTIKLVAGTTGTIRLTSATSSTLVRLVASVGTYDVSQYTNASKYADFLTLAPGTYTAYIATGFSGGNPIWSAGKSVTAQSSKTNTYSVP
jgi:hypothetical protein